MLAGLEERVRWCWLGLAAQSKSHLGCNIAVLYFSTGVRTSHQVRSIEKGEVDRADLLRGSRLRDSGSRAAFRHQ